MWRRHLRTRAGGAVFLLVGMVADEGEVCFELLGEWMVFAEHLLANGEGMLKYGGCFFDSAESVIGGGEVVA